MPNLEDWALWEEFFCFVLCIEEGEGKRRGGRGRAEEAPEAAAKAAAETTTGAAGASGGGGAEDEEGRGSSGGLPCCCCCEFATDAFGGGQSVPGTKRSEDDVDGGGRGC